MTAGVLQEDVPVPTEVFETTVTPNLCPPPSPVGRIGLGQFTVAFKARIWAAESPVVGVVIIRFIDMQILLGFVAGTIGFTREGACLHASPFAKRARPASTTVRMTRMML